MAPRSRTPAPLQATVKEDSLGSLTRTEDHLISLQVVGTAVTSWPWHSPAVARVHRTISPMVIPHTRAPRVERAQEVASQPGVLPFDAIADATFQQHRTAGPTWSC